MMDRTPTEGTQFLVDLRTPTYTYVSGFRTSPSSVVVNGDRELVERALLAEQQLAAVQGFAAGLQVSLDAAQTELDEERAARQALEAQLAAEQANHALTEALYAAEKAEALRLSRLHAEASSRAAQSAVRIAWMMRVLALVGEQRIEWNRGDEETDVVDDPDARGGGR